MPRPKFTAQRLGDYISQCMANGGAVTINLGIIVIRFELAKRNLIA